jgi:Tfp pilus assembly protein PilF
MERCPNCSARWDGGANCRRCDMELEGLVAVEKAAERSLARGIGYLAATEPRAARRELARALDLQRTPLAELLLDFARWLEQEPVDSDHATQQPLQPSDEQLPAPLK